MILTLCSFFSMFSVRYLCVVFGCGTLPVRWYWPCAVSFRSSMWDIFVWYSVVEVCLSDSCWPCIFSHLLYAKSLVVLGCWTLPVACLRNACFVFCCFISSFWCLGNVSLFFCCLIAHWLVFNTSLIFVECFMNYPTIFCCFVLSVWFLQKGVVGIIFTDHYSSIFTFESFLKFRLCSVFWSCIFHVS